MIEQIDIREIVEVDELTDMIDMISKAVQLPVSFRDYENKYSNPANTNKHCEFCKIINDCEEGKRRCDEFKRNSGNISYNLGNSYIARCHAGLVEIFAPVIINDYYAGYFCVGPIMMWEWDEHAVNEFIKRTKDLPVSEAKLLSASLKVPVIESVRAKAITDIVMICVENLTFSSLAALEEQRNLNTIQSKIANVVQDKKNTEKAISSLEKRGSGNNYPIHKERELLCKVRIGDRIGANEILNDILGDIFLNNAGDINVIKARLLELMVIISREAVEAGASMDLMLSLNHKTVTELININDFESMCRWISLSLEQMIDTIYETSTLKNAGTLSNIMDYIRKNYNKTLTLDIVAKSVYLSPYYISHLFKEQLDITFIGYLTRTRIEESKHLLKRSSMSVSSIASSVGYEDAGYFSKVFKRYTGMTPKQYKNL